MAEHRVNAGSNLQAAIDAAVPGDSVIGEAGATFPRIELPHKTGEGWVDIKSSRADELDPNKRVFPTDAGKLMKILDSPDSNHAAIATHRGAHHYRLTGIEAAKHPGGPALTIVSLDSGDQGPGHEEHVPHHLEIDRMYIHGLSDEMAAVRGMALNSKYTKVKNSYISEIHGHTTDSHAIYAWNSPGELDVDNNYLEASSICLQFGYGDPSLTPKNVRATRNHLTRPLSWRGRYPNVKNLFEIKGVEDCLFEANLCENNWADGQSGHALALTSYYNPLKNLTVRLNKIRKVGAGITLSGGLPIPGQDFGTPSSTDNVKVIDNLFDEINPVLYGNPWRAGVYASGHSLAFGGYTSHILYDHNTFIGGHGITIDGNSMARSIGAIIRNTILGMYPGVGGWSVMKTFPEFQAILERCLIIGVGGHAEGDIFGYGDYSPVPPVPSYPQASLYPSLDGSMLWFTEVIEQVGFLDSVARNFRLATDSAYKNKGTDGKDIGADIDAIDEATKGCVSGIWDGSAPPPIIIPPEPNPEPPPVESPDGTKGPTVTDGNGGVWTIGSSNQTLKNGVHMGGGLGTEYKYLTDVVYTHGTDSNWHQWDGSKWIVFGSTEPGVTPIPEPPPGPAIGSLKKDVPWDTIEGKQDSQAAAQRAEGYYFYKNQSGKKATFVYTGVKL